MSKVIGEFTWLFDDKFFVEIEGVGNFIWSDPNYGGDNLVNETELTYDEYVKRNYPDGFCGRSKGRHEVNHYIK